MEWNKYLAGLKYNSKSFCESLVKFEFRIHAPVHVCFVGMRSKVFTQIKPNPRVVLRSPRVPRVDAQTNKKNGMRLLMCQRCLQTPNKKGVRHLQSSVV